MKLRAPFMITARLLPGVKIGDVTLSIQDTGLRTPDNRTVYEYFIDGPGWTHSANDLKSGCGGGTLQEGMESLLSFLGAAAESYPDGENSDLFPAWAHQNSDEITLLGIELKETPGLITGGGTL